MVYQLHPVPDSAPLNLTGVSQDPTILLLSWEEPSGRHNGIIREYRLNITEVETGRLFQNVSATTTLLISNLHPDYTYEWTVAAVTVGEGPYSDIHSITTLEDGRFYDDYIVISSTCFHVLCCPVPSGPPINFNGSSLNSSSIFLSWSPPLPEERNGDITGYTLNITNLDNETVHQLTTGPVTSFTVTSLNVFTLYEVRVSAQTAVGTGQSPAVLLVQTDEDGMPMLETQNSHHAVL